MTRQIIFFHELGTNTCLFWDDAKGRFDGGKRPRIVFRMGLRPVFHWPQVQPQEQERPNRRRSSQEGARKKPFLGGSDPTLCGFRAAQRLRHRRSLPPKLFFRFVGFVAG